MPGWSRMHKLPDISLDPLPERFSPAKVGFKRLMPFMFVALLGLFALGFIEWRRQSEIDTARATHIKESSAEAQAAAFAFESKMLQVYQNLRTIARLPGVQKLERHALNFDENARWSVQEIYNNLSQNVDVSEVYIVPLSFNPERMDPVTGKLEEPIIHFDELITNRTADRPVEGAAESKEVEEIEIHEYRYMRAQLDRFHAAFPNKAIGSGLEYPAMSSPALITCDNTRYSPSNPDDRDRMGIIYSVPYYGEDRQLRGMISAVILVEALSEMLPQKDFALSNPAAGLTAPSSAFGDWQRYATLISKGEAEPQRIFSRSFDIPLTDLLGPWRLWARSDDATFWQRSDVHSAQEAARIASFMTLVLTFSLMVLIRVLQLNLTHARRQGHALEQAVQQRTAALEKSMLEAEASSLAKSEFLAMMSHEIRTPMNGVLGMTSVLLDSPLSPEQKRHASTIRDSAENLLRIINDVLDFSKLEAKAMEFEDIPFDLYALLDYAVEIVQPRAKAKGLDLRLNFGFDVLQHVRSDPGRIRQVILNLLGNAVKFTERGSVTLHVTTACVQNASPCLRFEIIDTGIGIPEDRRDRLFQSFSQTDASMSRRFGGTGLGLAISKKIVSCMGGAIGVDSIVGKGSTFWFELPVGAASSGEVDASSLKVEQLQIDAALEAIASLGRPLRLLVAEDNATNQLVVKSVLAKFGIVPDFAGNGIEAIEALKLCSYDAVLMDVHMPEMDGLTATKILRSLPGPVSCVPVIALTANAFSHDVDHCRAAGMNAHVGKPFRTEELLVAIGDALRGQSRFTPAAETAAPLPVSGAMPDSTVPALDIEVIEKFRADSGEEMLQMLIETFLPDATAKLERLAQIAGQPSSPETTTEAVRLAHSLKSSGAMAGAMQLSVTAKAVEKRLHDDGAVLSAEETTSMRDAFAAYADGLKERGLAA